MSPVKTVLIIISINIAFLLYLWLVPFIPLIFGEQSPDLYSFNLATKYFFITAFFGLLLEGIFIAIARWHLTFFIKAKQHFGIEEVIRIQLFISILLITLAYLFFLIYSPQILNILVLGFFISFPISLLIIFCSFIVLQLPVLTAFGLVQFFSLDAYEK